MKKRFLTAVVLTISILGLRAADLSRATFTQVVNEVDIVDAKTTSMRGAKLNDVLVAPDLVRTGPGSRAELTAPDKTLTRIGANTVLSFDPSGRNIRLDRGSLLFHSPKGKGGGTVTTGKASAAVLGTTIMLVATPNGGFKGIVLEGEGRFTMGAGASRRLTAGQEVYVLPNGRGFSPILNINLSRLVTDSGFVKNYSSPLASLPKVQAAIKTQDDKLKRGVLQETGLLAGSTATETTVTVVDSVTFSAAVKENQQAVDKSWKRDLKIDGARIPSDRVFDRDERRYPKNSVWSDSVSRAALGQDITIDSENVILPRITPSQGNGSWPALFGIVADQDLIIKDSVDFHPASNHGGPPLAPPSLVLAGGDVQIKAGSSVRYLADADLAIAAQKTLTFDEVSIQTQGGSVKLQSLSGSIQLAATYVSAHPDAKLDVIAKKGKATMVGGSLTAGNIQIVAGDKVDIRNTDFRIGNGDQNLPSLAMQAETIVLANVNLPDGTVLLQSGRGSLAPAANTRQTVMTGYVNFYENVKKHGNPAEQYVAGYADAAIHRTAEITIGVRPGRTQ
ncbi:MAG: FecR domain-containing protein [Verrucomicrobia bacterium]|nr:FecR domain-containing protein [Verrucomicrobiota bacterium]